MIYTKNIGQKGNSFDNFVHLYYKEHKQLKLTWTNKITLYLSGIAVDRNRPTKPSNLERFRQLPILAIFFHRRPRLPARTPTIVDRR